MICRKNMPMCLVSGNARSKKAAKRVAAQAMLTHIKGLVDENNGESAQLEEEDEDIPLVSRTARAHPAISHVAICY